MMHDEANQIKGRCSNYQNTNSLEPAPQLRWENMTSEPHGQCLSSVFIGDCYNMKLNGFAGFLFKPKDASKYINVRASGIRDVTHRYAHRESALGYRASAWTSP